MQLRHKNTHLSQQEFVTRNNRTTKLYSLLQKVFVVCALIAGTSVILSHEYSLALLLALVTGYFINKRPLPHFTIILFGGGLALRIVIVTVLHTPPESDFLFLYDAAQSLLVGDKSFLDTVYFSLWAYQSMFVVWEAALLKICNSIIFLKCVNAVFSAGSVCLLYRTMRGFVSEKAAQIFALLLTIQPFILTFHVVLSNQIPSAFFMILGIWVLISEDCAKLQLWRFPLAGLLLQIGNMLRCEAIILLVAILTWVVFEMLRRPKIAKYFLTGIVLLLAVYAATGKVADTAIRVTGVNPYGLQNGDPDWKLVIGLNAETRGAYSNKDWSKIYPSLDENNQITDETRKIQNEIIQERIHISVGDWMKLLRNKIQMLWNTDNLHWAFHHALDAAPMDYVGFITRYDAFNLLKGFNLALGGTAIVLLMLGLWQYKSLPSPASYLPFFVFFAAFCAFLVIEVQPRYVYLPQLFVFASSAYGIDQLLRWGNSFKNG